MKKTTSLQQLTFKILPASQVKSNMSDEYISQIQMSFVTKPQVD